MFVTKAVDYGVVGTVAGVWAASSIPVGSLSLFSANGANAGAGAAGSVTANFNGTWFTISSMTADGVMSSIKIDKGSLSYYKKAYTAPVKAVKFLGSNVLNGTASEKGNLNLPSTLTAGEVVGVTVIDKTKQVNDISRSKTYSFITTTGDLLDGVTAKNIIAKLVVIINADANRVVDVAATQDGSSNYDGIKFTARTAGNDFAIARVDGVLKDANICEYNIVDDVYTTSVTNAVATNPGHGTYAQIVELMKEYDTRDGNTHTQKYSDYMWSHTNNLVAGQTYTTYHLHFTPAVDSPADRDNNHKLQVLIAVDSTATDMITDLDTLLAGAVA